MSDNRKPLVKVEINKPGWLTGKLVLTLFLIAAACVGGYFWGMRSVDVDVEAAIGDYLLTEPTEMQKGRLAGHSVWRVGNSTISLNWIDFCDAVITDCDAILQERE